MSGVYEFDGCKYYGDGREVSEHDQPESRSGDREEKPEAKVGGQCDRLLQRISGVIGMMNDGPQRRAVSEWWRAIRPALNQFDGGVKQHVRPASGDVWQGKREETRGAVVPPVRLENLDRSGEKASGDTITEPQIDLGAIAGAPPSIQPESRPGLPVGVGPCAEGLTEKEATACECLRTKAMGVLEKLKEKGPAFCAWSDIEHMESFLLVPCPCEGMRQKIELLQSERRGLLGLIRAGLEDIVGPDRPQLHALDLVAAVAEKCDSLRAELAAAVSSHTELSNCFADPMSDVDRLCIEIESERAQKESAQEKLAASQERERALREALTNLRELMDPADAGYIYDGIEAECNGCSQKATTMAEIKHDEDCIVLALQVAAAALATPEGTRP